MLVRVVVNTFACLLCVVWLSWCVFFFSSRRRHTRCALVTGVQTCALPICGIGHDREKGFECARCKRSVEFASNGALPRPTVDEHGVLGAMPGCDLAERITVDPATANDPARSVEGLHAKPGQRMFAQDPDARRSDARRVGKDCASKCRSRGGQSHP